MMPSINAINLVRKFEGCRLTSYEDLAGVWTVGYGHTPCIKNVIIDQATADSLLIEDLNKAGKDIDIYVGQVNQNQYDALCSFIFNVGIGNFLTSTLRKYLLTKNYQDAALEFLRWNYVKGVIIEGLTNRRLAEKELFLS